MKKIWGMILGLSLLSACGGNKGDEIKRMTSPDGKVDAVIVDYTGGALSSYQYGVYLCPKGAKWTQDSMVAYLHKADNLRLKWRESGFVEIQYSKGSVVKFRSTWSSTEIERSGYYVEVRLFPESRWSIPEKQLTK